MRWKPDSRMRKEASKKFQDALIMEFNKHYGTDAKNLKSWQTLCAAVNVDPIPDNLAEARQAILGVHVNLVDLTRKRVRYRRSKYPLRGVPWDDGSEYDQSEDDEPEYGESEYGESEDDDSSGDDEWEYGEWKYGESEYDDFKLEDDKDWMKEDNDPYPMPAMHDFDWF
ncbi:hypothetical protein EST38_g6204 [Candolleomyces aberdarensis]|uniref:Uncharacterized protein n=1 Tax=Candolleomyces aberdarensis TaxID=2316362 RepID=A0A4Q2DLJ9_9AGAR|nr:hypothetical protein EST38_g6204 [Candolleomyces aberdarensis]